MFCFFLPDVENIRNRTFSIPYAFSISFGQSEENSLRLIAFSTLAGPNNAKILISEPYNYNVYFS